MEQYADFLVQLTAAEVRTRAEGGSPARGPLSAPPAALALLLNQADQRILQGREAFVAFGSALYLWVFSSPTVREALESAARDAHKHGKVLRLGWAVDEEARVGVGGDVRLASVPWEFLYRPDYSNEVGYFLAADPRLAFSRRTAVRGDRPRPAEDGARRILSVASQPSNRSPVLTEAADAYFRGECQAAGLAIEPLLQPTRQTFREQLDRRPFAVHFLGHAEFTAEGGCLVLIDSRGEADPTPEGWLTDALGHTPPVRIVLIACDSGRSDSARAFVGLAPRLARANVPEVVAMQFPISNRVALAFIRTFYAELAQGRPTDVAVQVARRQLRLDLPDGANVRDFAAPVVYLRQEPETNAEADAPPIDMTELSDREILIVVRVLVSASADLGRRGGPDSVTVEIGARQLIVRVRKSFFEQQATEVSGIDLLGQTVAAHLSRIDHWRSQIGTPADAQYNFAGMIAARKPALTNDSAELRLRLSYAISSIAIV